MWKPSLVLAGLVACSGGGGSHVASDAEPKHVDAPNLPHDAGPYLDAPLSGLCGNPGSGQGCTLTNWSFVAISGDARTATPSNGCTTQFNSAAIIARPTDTAGKPTATCTDLSAPGACVVDIYDCTAATGTQILPVGTWQRELQITDNNRTAIYATSPDTFLGTVDEVNIPVTDVDFVTNGGYFHATWATAACAGGANRRVLLSTPISVDEFACEDGQSPYNYSARLPAGPLDVTARLYDATGDIGPLEVDAITIGQASAIAPVTFSL